ncbi:MAG: hypothetical protein ACRYGG_21080 [Janthinobacterium lividum]
MSYFDATQSPETMLAEMKRQQVQAYMAVRSLLVSQAQYIYADPSMAIAFVQAMGAGATTQFGVSAATLSWLDGLAEVMGVQPIGSIVPDGYSITPAADGTVAVSYVAPAPTPDPTPAT